MADFLQTLAQNLNLTADQLQKLAANAELWKELELKQLAADVARANDGTQLTRRGFELLAKALAGKELHYTRIKLGNANGQTVDDATLYEMNDLINPLYEANITQVQHTGGGCCAVKSQVVNATVENGFRIAEAGLFATDPDTGEEVMYCYQNSGIASSWMPAGDGAVLWNLVFTMITVVDRAQNITATIDGSLIFLTQTEFLEHISSSNPHPNIPQKKEPVDAANYIWVNGGDDNLHTMPVSSLAKQILGGEANAIPQLNSRLTQAEINLTNLYTRLTAEKQLGIQGNLLMAENFSDNDCCDMYTCAVITAVAGVANCRIDNDKGILVGSRYTISDGTRSEPVLVKSIARNDDAVVVIFDHKLENTYDLTRTQLLRTTVSITDKQATGAGDVQGSSLTFTEKFTGSGSNTVMTVTLETTQSNASNFTVTDDGAFTNDGYFTMA